MADKLKANLDKVAGGYGGVHMYVKLVSRKAVPWFDPAVKRWGHRYKDIYRYTVTAADGTRKTFSSREKADKFFNEELGKLR